MPSGVLFRGANAGCGAVAQAIGDAVSLGRGGGLQRIGTLHHAAFPQDRVNGLMAGAVDYITKPFVFDEVRLRLIVHLRSRLADGDGPAPSPSGTTPSSLESILFQTARRHLLQQLHRTPDLGELAAAAGTNTKRLNDAFRKCAGSTAFKDRFGLSPSDFRGGRTSAHGESAGV